jgi:Peptidase inhibitor family I36
MGNAVVRSPARRIRLHPRKSPAFRALGQGLYVAAGIALMIGAAQIGGRPVGATLPAGPSSGQARHCVARLGAPTMRCFTALNAAVAAATNGRVHLLAGTTGAALQAIPLNQGAGASDYHVVSIEWTRPNYSGASLTWQAPSSCGDFASSSMPRGWNDAIRSVAQYSGCATTLYWDMSFGGATQAIDVNASVPDLGSFDGNVSSQKWCPESPCN